MGIIVYLVTKKIYSSNAEAIIAKAKAKAKAIEYEAHNLLQENTIKIKELELQTQKELDEKSQKIRADYEQKLENLEKERLKHSQHIDRETQWLEEQKREIELMRRQVLNNQDEQEKLKKEYLQTKKKMVKILSNYTRLSIEEAKNILLTNLEEELSQQKAFMIRQYEQNAKDEAKKRANYIIAQATTRYAGEFATERLINVVNLPSDELKGRIIGKEGRNIKTLESISGVDIIIDDTPNSIVLSSFNLYRRAIATKLLENLVEDGRIQPARIEEMYERVKNEMDEMVLKDGEDIVLDMRLGNMSKELTYLVGKLKYRASYGQNALAHSIEVANLAGIIACELGGDEKIARRAGLLHDIGKALTQDVGGNHVDLGYELCAKYKEHPIVLNAIKAHHGYEEIDSVECAAVCAADTLSAARPGARKEALEQFMKRMQDIEKIAMNKIGVKQAYAINAGREVRVIIKADMIDDNQSVVIAREIAQEIESSLQYPGEIKVSVIRESRAVAIAH